ncbi:hypothetical protein JVT61DRAFT_13034 [Boletus reticuloceps]|uniref:Uncharacterized protein n=1 Tax=Boletus reticuloceps TaxID=495285 RepID=A0A8I2YUS5_9AGAM|nr:hypothetical protein JVT61DRAFT_13034 [Boletus reticuloceps]
MSTALAELGQFLQGVKKLTGEPHGCSQSRSWIAPGVERKRSYTWEYNTRPADRFVMVQRELILCELVHMYIVAGRHKEALEELELFELQVLHYESFLTYLDISSLPSFPYHDNAVLHVYAGICSVLTAQPSSASEVDVQSIDSEMLDRAQIFFERAKSLDPENIVVDSLLGIIPREDSESVPGSNGSPAGRSRRRRRG